MGFGRRGVAATLSVLALAGFSLAGAPSGQAHEPVSCQGPENTSFSPGLSLLPRATRIDADVSYSCSGAEGEPLPATGHIHGGSSAAACVNAGSLPAQPRPSKEVVHYADGEKSVIVYTSAPLVTRAAGVQLLTLRGEVVAGRGKGGRATRTIALLPTQLPTACLTPEGLRQANGAAALRITPNA